MPSKKKKASKIRRMQKRAEERGETYVPPIIAVDVTNDDTATTKGAKEIVDPNESENDPIVDQEIDTASPQKASTSDHSAGKRQQIAVKLCNELAAIDADTALKAKERRSAKRKAEAIAIEQSGCSSVEELLALYEEEAVETTKPKPKTVPYILFVGQLSFTTTKEQIHEYFLAHIRKHAPDAATKDPIVSIRLLTDAKTGKSRGMAFVQVDSVDTLFLLLQLHQTHFDGRRINVERTAGSGKARRKVQLDKLATQRQQATQATVDGMWKEFQLHMYDGDVLDAGVKALCTRHSSTVVRASLERFVETNGHERDNPSAYLTALLGKLATEGIFEKRELQQQQRGSDRKRSYERPASSSQPFRRPPPRKQQRR